MLCTIKKLCFYFINFFLIWKIIFLMFNFNFFQSAKARLKVMEEEMRALQWEHEVLEQRFEKVC